MDCLFPWLPFCFLDTTLTERPCRGQCNLCSTEQTWLGWVAGQVPRKVSPNLPVTPGDKVTRYSSLISAVINTEESSSEAGRGSFGRHFQDAVHR